MKPVVAKDRTCRGAEAAPPYRTGPRARLRRDVALPAREPAPRRQFRPKGAGCARSSSRCGGSGAKQERSAAKMQGARRHSAARPLSSSSHSFHNPGFFYCPFRVTRPGGSRLERVVLPQTLRRPAPNLLAAASFSHIIASPLFGRVTRLGGPAMQIFSGMGRFGQMFASGVQKCWAVDHLVAHRAPFIASWMA